MTKIKMKRESNVDAAYCKWYNPHFYYGRENEKDGIHMVTHYGFVSTAMVIC